MSNNTGIETTLRQLATLARTPNEKIVRQAAIIAGVEPTVRKRVQAIADWIRAQGVGSDPTRGESLSLEPPYDADDAVLVAASMCVALDIPCRIVGARVRESWTCWLSFLDGTQWQTADVIAGRMVLSDMHAQERIEVRVQEANDKDSHEQRSLPSGVQIEVRNETRYNVERSVSLKSPCPEHPQNMPIEVAVGGSVSSYKPEPEPPTVRLPSCSLTRKQWELIKRLGDQAWNEYEERFGGQR